jgi:hypothetical protein
VKEPAPVELNPTMPIGATGVPELASPTDAVQLRGEFTVVEALTHVIDVVEARARI